MSGSPFAIEAEREFQGISLAVSPDNNFLYAGNVDPFGIRVFHISPNGALMPIAAGPYLLGGQILGMKVSPDGKFLAVAVDSFLPLPKVAILSIGNNGILTQVSSPPFELGGVIAASVEFNCPSNLLFIGEHSGPTTTDVFSVSSNGVISPIPGSPFIQNSGRIGNSGQIVLLSPNERFLFVSNQFSDTITVWNVASNGSLTLVAGSSFAAGGIVPAGIAINRAGTLLYVANADDVGPSSISVFSIAANGTLTAAPGSPFRTGQGRGLRSLAAYPGKNCVSAPTFDLCLEDDSDGSVFQINSTTGEYQFNRCSGVVLSGVGVIIRKGGITTMQHYASDRRVVARVDTAINRGTASIQMFSPLGLFTITDRNITNNTCSCR